MNFTLGLEQATLFYKQKQPQEAITVLLMLQRQNLLPEQWYLVYKTLAGCYFMAGDLARSSDYYRQALVHCCGPYLSEKTMLYSNYLFLQHYLPQWNDEELAKEHFAYSALVNTRPAFVHLRKDKDKLRIGYLSPDFCEHVNMFFFIQLLARCNRKRYEVIGYSVSGREDHTTQQLQRLASGWRDLSALSSEDAARVIYEDCVDILFDLSGHASGGVTLPIMDWHPAPVQVCGIGYMSTTGDPAVDYFLTDVYCDPPGAGDSLFTEKLVRLPHTHLCYTPSERALHCQKIYAVHTPVVFGSFNNFAKVTDQMLQLWLTILQQVPGSHLLLKDSGNLPFLAASLRRRAESIGFRTDQLELRLGTGNYLDEYYDIDIALDTYPYVGGGTTCDALYMGVPVISLFGTRHSTRFGYSLLMNVGLGELAAGTAEAYMERAVALAKEPLLLTELHHVLRSLMKKSPLMNGWQYVQEMENAYEAMWRRWLCGEE